MRSSWIGVALVLALAACSGEENRTPSALDDGGGSPRDSGQPDDGGDPMPNGNPDTGAGGMATEPPDADLPDVVIIPPLPEASVPDAEGPCEIPSGAEVIAAPADPEGVCSASGFATGVLIESAGTARADSMRSVTPDELDVAWFAPVSDSDDTLVLHYAGRHYPSGGDEADFFAARTIPPGDYAPDGIALSPDGLRMIVVTADRKGFTQYIRTLRDDPFDDVPSDVAFEALRLGGDGFLPEELRIGDPVLSSDDRTLYYSLYEDGAGLYYSEPSTHGTIHASTRNTGAPWSFGMPLTGAAISAHCELRRRPTGVSSDQLTLFYWDELSGSARAAFRASLDDPFDTAIDLGERVGAQPNTACTLLYYSDPDDGDLWVAPEN